MADETFPAALPRYLKAYTVDVVTDKIRDKADTALWSNRRRSETKIHLVKVEWLLTDAELTTFTSWFNDDVDFGSKIFDIDLAIGNGIATNTAKFGLGQYSHTFTGNKDWHVTAELEVWDGSVNDTVAEFFTAHEALFVTTYGTTPIASMWLPLSLATLEGQSYKLQSSAWLDLSTATLG